MENFSTDGAYRALDSVARLLAAVSASEVEEVEKRKMELLRRRFEEQRRADARKAAVAPVEGRPTANLKPWRDVVTPHPDVAPGWYRQAEFAADLWQVYMGEGSDEYEDPTKFFRRTFLTDGLKQLLTRAVERLPARATCGLRPSLPVDALTTGCAGRVEHPGCDRQLSRHSCITSVLQGERVGQAGTSCLAGPVGEVLPGVQPLGCTTGT